MSIRFKDRVVQPDEDTIPELSAVGSMVEHEAVGVSGRRWIQRRPLFFLRLLLTAGLFCLAARSVVWQDVPGLVQHIDYGLVLGGIMVGCVYMILVAYQQRCLLDGEQVSLDLRVLVRLLFVRTALDHLGPLESEKATLSGVILSPDEYPRTASAILASRIVGFIVVLFVACGVLVFAHALFPVQITELFLCVCAGLCAWLASLIVLRWILPHFHGQQFLVRFTQKGLFVTAGLRKSITHPRFLLASICFAALYDLCAALNYYAYASVFQIHVPIQFFLLVIPIVSLAGFLPVFLNGYGVREVILTFLFSTLHISFTASFLLAVLMDIQVLMFGLIGGYLCLADRKRKDRYVPIHVSKQI